RLHQVVEDRLPVLMQQIAQLLWQRSGAVPAHSALPLIGNSQLDADSLAAAQDFGRCHRRPPFRFALGFSLALVSTLPWASATSWSKYSPTVMPFFGFGGGGAGGMQLPMMPLINS